MLWSTKTSMKGKCYRFSGYKQKKKVLSEYLEYLECKIQEDGYTGSIFKLKCHKNVGRTYLEKGKEQTRYRWCF